MVFVSRDALPYTYSVPWKFDVLFDVLFASRTNISFKKVKFLRSSLSVDSSLFLN